MTSDRLDVHPPKTTVLKRIGDGGLSAWGGVSYCEMGAALSPPRSISVI